jgi:peptidoglycan/LPS O-acetylase OafA/YrhL
MTDDLARTTFIADGSPRERLAHLDGMRGIAALSVVLFHLGLAHGPSLQLGNDLPRPVQVAIGDHGRLGVAVFFVISGYVMALSVPSGALDLAGVRSFLARRFGRVTPPYYVAIALAIVAAVLIWRMSGDPFDVRGADLTVGRVLAHLVYLEDPLHQVSFNGVFWTLYYEVAYYVLFAVCCWLVALALQRGPRAATAVRHGRVLDQRLLVCCALVVLGTVGNWTAFLDRHAGMLPLSFLPAMHAFVLGVLARWLSVARSTGLAILAGAFTALVVIGGFSAEMPFKVASIITAAILVGMPRLPALARVLGARPLQRLGLVSYSLYLVHPAVFDVLSRVVNKTVGIDDATGQLVFCVIGVPAAVVAAAVMYRWVEVPAIRWSRRLGRRRTRAAESVLAERTAT